MRLHKLLEQYLGDVEAVVDKMTVYAEQYQEEILTDSRINLRLRLRFENGHLLAINEAVVVEDNKLSCLGYRYHFQNEKSTLIFRYDDTPHFPEIDTFPHHKHYFDDVLSSQKPTVIEAIREAELFVAEQHD